MFILVVEDDPQVRSLVCRVLANDGHDVSSVGTATDARSAIKSSPPGLVLLDIGLPGGDGLELGRWIKGHYPNMGIIIVTGKIDVSERIAGLDSGADDYISKPFDTDELCARVRSLSRRLGHLGIEAEAVLVRKKIGAWEIDADLSLLASGEVKVRLTNAELRLLIALAERPGRTATREWLLERVEAGEDIGERTVDFHVHTLRKKLKECGLGDVITAIRGIGYAFTPPSTV